VDIAGKAANDARYALLLTDLLLVRVKTIAAILKRLPGIETVDLDAVAEEVKAGIETRTADAETIRTEGVDDFIALIKAG